MIAGYTRQTPQATKEWLSTQTIVFPEDWTLDDVADECHRRFLSDRWPGGEVQAARSVVAWATLKLAKHPYFTSEHWEWIAAIDKFDRHDGYYRLQEILSPAIAANVAWKKTSDERKELLQEIDKAAAYLLKTLDMAMRLNVSLRDVVGWFPEMQPLRDYSADLQSQQFERGLKAAREARRMGADLAATIHASIQPDGYREPRLSDYLWTLRAALQGASGESRPNGRAGTTIDVLDDLTPDEADIMAKRFGISYGKTKPADALRSSGDFGAYPARKDALRRAVILAFPAAIFDRLTDPPKVTPASVIETACVAWFGSAPTAKEINAAIKPARGTLEPSMKRFVNGYKKSAERRSKWEAAGLSEDEIRKKEFQSFLDEE